MNPRRRQLPESLDGFDVKIINTKVKLYHKLVSAHIDYDHYRAGALPPGNMITIRPWLRLGEVFCDISPCDFANFKSKLLTRYTVGRADIDPQVPQFYGPREKEERIFKKHMSEILPAKIQEYRRTYPKSPYFQFFDDEFRLDYPTVLTRRFRK
ncbi:hypothetical protein JCM33374_g259 [Metschnikowia sp. JCM 33374]|nr:hypothetical protein JCM33374_g259 [Metschnikowia sp. JCM 33374]